MCTQQLKLFFLGGLLVCLPQEKAQKYCEELETLDGCPAWIIGDVVTGDRKAEIAKDIKIIEV